MADQQDDKTVQDLEANVQNLSIESRPKKTVAKKASASKDESGVPPGLPRVPKPFLTLTWDVEKPKEIESQEYSQSNPFMAQITYSTYLTSADAVKRCLHVELDISGSNLSFEPGDAIGIVCGNPPEQIAQLASRLNLDPSRTFSLTGDLPIHLHSYMSVSLALSRIDLRTIPKKSFLRLLSEFTSDPTEKQRLYFLMSREGSSEYIKNYCTSVPSLFEILTDFPSCFPPLVRLLETLPPLHPRYYSVTNFPRNSVEIAFNVVEWMNGKGEFIKGVCTTWLEQVCEKKVRIPVFRKEGGDFRLPRNDMTPIIMVGPGTGVAPFRGFLQHRHNQKMNGHSVGKSVLFFGCRHEKRDYIYKKDFENFLHHKTLSHLYTAFSRDTEKKIYVQHKMEEEGKMIAELMLNENAIFYMCGDAKGMIKGIQEAMINVLVQHGNKTKEEAGELLNQWIKEKRFIMDIWL